MRDGCRVSLRWKNRKGWHVSGMQRGLLDLRLQRVFTREQIKAKSWREIAENWKARILEGLSMWVLNLRSEPEALALIF